MKIHIPEGRTRMHWFIYALCWLDIRFWRCVFTATLAVQRLTNWFYGYSAYQLGLANKNRFEQKMLEEEDSAA